MPRDLIILLSLRSYAPRPAHQGQNHSAAGTAHRAVPSCPAGLCSARTTPPPAPGIAPSPAPRSSTSDGATAGRFVHRQSNTGGTPAKNHQTQPCSQEASSGSLFFGAVSLWGSASGSVPMCEHDDTVLPCSSTAVHTSVLLTIEILCDQPYQDLLFCLPGLRRMDPQSST